MPTTTEGWSQVGHDVVTKRWPADEPMPFTDDQLDELIGDVEDLLIGRIPDLPGRIGSEVPRRRLERIMARILIRHARNPAGIRTLQESGGSYSASTTYAGDTPGDLVLTDDDVRDLLNPARTGRQAFTIRPNVGR